MMTLGPLNKLNFLVLSSIFFLVWRNILTTVVCNTSYKAVISDLIFLLLLKIFQKDMNKQLAKEMNYKIFKPYFCKTWFLWRFWIQLFINVNFTRVSFPYNWKNILVLQTFFCVHWWISKIKIFFLGFSSFVIFLDTNIQTPKQKS